MLANKALLVYVSISQWTGRKLDRRATETVAVTHRTNNQAGNYHKKLLPGSHELAKVSMIAGQIRKYFYGMTLPWFSDGARIIKSSSYMTFANEFRKMKSDYDRAVAEFISVYPALQKAAQNSLGSLYSPSDYPSAHKLANAFQCEVNFLPLPDVKDFRVEISDAEKRAFVNKMKAIETDAMRDVWTRLHDVVQKAAEKLAQPDAIFRDSLLDNVTDLCALLPKLNVTDDPELEKARVNVEKAVSKMKPEILRDNAKDRQDAAAKLAEISKTMGAFMGGAK